VSTLYLDLDGTLVDVRRRHYLAYADTLLELGVTPLADRRDWTRRRRGVRTFDLLNGCQQSQRQRFVETWLKRIESPEYLRLDTLIPGATAALGCLAEPYELVLITLRRDGDSLKEQLVRLELTPLLSRVYWRMDCAGPGSKAKLIRRVSPGAAAPSLVVGDSEADIEAARELGIQSVCVTTGVRNRSYLEAAGAHHVIRSISRLPDLLLGLRDVWERERRIASSREGG